MLRTVADHTRHCGDLHTSGAVAAAVVLPETTEYEFLLLKVALHASCTSLQEW